ncbi:hypothetical protein [Streptomyces sp. NPDC057939]|uniref:hypothetical protein n=1 Tax=Streptomyces sp. NPDC057939 TaxID=3346284 RepID=UPI0036EE3910
MHLIEFVLSRPSRGESSLPERALLAALWAADLPGDGIEHIRVHPSRAGARGIVFCLAEDGVSATLRVRALCARALAQAPPLNGWRLDSVSAAHP